MAAGTLGIALASPVLALADEPLRLSPTSDWALNYADEYCELARTFGGGEDEVTLNMRSFGPGGMFVLFVVGNPTELSFTPDDIGIKLADVEDFRVRYRTLELGGRPGIVSTNPITLGPPADDVMDHIRNDRPVPSYSAPEFERRVTEIEFFDGFKQHLVLQTGSMSGPITALKECTRELSTHWPVDVATHNAMSRVAAPDPTYRKWIRLRDMPSDLRLPGMWNVRMIVEPDGGIAECTIPDAPSAEFSAALCELLEKKARNKGALDANGNPARDYLLSWTVLDD